MNNSSKILKVKETIDDLIKVSYNILPNNNNMSDARFHLQQAAKHIDKVVNSNKKKDANKNQSESWWANIVSGTAKMSQAGFSPQGYAKSLSQLNLMIDNETKKINDLEKQSLDMQNQNVDNSELFND